MAALCTWQTWAVWLCPAACGQTLQGRVVGTEGWEVRLDQLALSWS